MNDRNQEKESKVLGTIGDDILADGGAIVFTAKNKRFGSNPDTMEIVQKIGKVEYATIWANVPVSDVMGFFDEIDWPLVGDEAGLSKAEMASLSMSKDPMERAVLVYIAAAVLDWEAISSDVDEDTAVFSTHEMKKRWPTTL